MDTFLESLFGPLLKTYLAQRLQLPTAELPGIAADAATYTSDGQPLTVDQVQAADRAIIDYLLGRLIAQAVPKGLTTAQHAAVTSTLSALGLPVRSVPAPVVEPPLVMDGGAMTPA